MTKLLKRFFLVLLLLVILAGLIPVLFPGAMTRQVVQWANSNINGKLSFSKTRISLFSHFPQLTLSIHDISLTGAPPYAADTLFAGKELSFGIDLLSLFRKKLTINGIYLERGSVNILVDADGRANYNILKTTPSSEEEKQGKDAELKIKEVVVSSTDILYHDRSIPLRIAARNLDYRGEADVRSQLYDLTTRLQIGSLDVVYDSTGYLQNKRLNAEMVTRINTASLSFEFKKNKLSINELPIDFSGELRFIQEGYVMDLGLVSGTTDLKNVFSILPASYTKWAAQTEILGKSKITINMKGTYSAPTRQSPDLIVGMLLTGGSIRHAGAPFALEQVTLDATLMLPALNPDRVTLDVRNFRWNLGSDSGRATLQLKKQPDLFIAADMNGSINLAMLRKALGVDPYQASGTLYSKVNCRGNYQPASHRLPAGSATLKISNGTFSSADIPWPLTEIRFNGSAECKSGQMRDLAISLEPLQFKLGNDPLLVKARLHNIDNVHYNIRAEGKLDFAKLKAYLPEEDISVNGVMSGNLHLTGTVSDAKALRYERLSNNGNLNISDMRIRTNLYPDPFLLAEGRFEFRDDMASVRKVRLNYRKNRFSVSGTAARYFGWLLNREALQLEGDVSAPLLNLNDFMAYNEKKGTSSAPAKATATEVVQLPGMMDLRLNSAFGEIDYKNMALEGFKGNVRLAESMMTLDTAYFRVAGAVFGLSGNYKALNPQAASFALRVKADSFNISRAYQEIPLFQELASSASKAKGTVSMQYAIGGRLDAGMMPEYPTLRGGGWVRLEDVSVKGMKLFNEVGRITGRDSVTNPRLKGVLIKSSVANNRIKIERTKMRIRGFRPRIEGYVYFNGPLDLRMRLGLPPFGIIGIPLTIKGTSEKPKIKMKKEQLDPQEEEKD
jgi:AsmA protein